MEFSTRNQGLESEVLTEPPEELTPRLMVFKNLNPVHLQLALSDGSNRQ